MLPAEVQRQLLYRGTAAFNVSAGFYRDPTPTTPPDRNLQPSSFGPGDFANSFLTGNRSRSQSAETRRMTPLAG